MSDDLKNDLSLLIPLLATVLAIFIVGLLMGSILYPTCRHVPCLHDSVKLSKVTYAPSSVDIRP